MRVLVDVDGVLADFEGHARKEAGYTSEVTEMDFGMCLTNVERANVENSAIRMGFCASIPLYVGAQRFIRLLHESHDVYAVTAPWQSSTHWEYERRRWLRVAGFDRDKIISCPSAAKALIGGDVLIEDTPSTLVRWLHAHPNGLGLLRDLPWNQLESKTFGMLGGHPRMTRCRTYDEMLDKVS